MIPCCPLQTESGTVKIVTRCGKFSRTASPGCSFLWLPWCCFDAVAGTVSQRVQQLDARCNTKTMDNVFVNVEVAIQYKVIDGRERDAFYKLQDPKHQIESYVFDSVRAEVPKHTLDQLFLVKEQLSYEIKNTIGESMLQFGFEIIATPVTDIDPDVGVKNAMNEINRMERLKKAAEDKGEAEKILIIKQAESKAAQIRIEARADADSKQLAGEGISRQRQAIVDGLKKSVQLFTKADDGISTIDAKTVMDTIMIAQWYDTLKDMSHHSKTNTIFIPHSPAAVADIAGQLRQGIMEGNATAAAVDTAPTRQVLPGQVPRYTA